MVEKTSYLINQRQFIDFNSPLLHYIQLKTFDYVSYPVEYILFPGGIYAHICDTARPVSYTHLTLPTMIGV